VGVMQVLNKKEGAFNEEDESLLNALGSQTSIALENSQLFEEVQFMKRYNESILQTMATGIVTLDKSGKVAYANPAARAMFGEPRADGVAQTFAELLQQPLNTELVAGIEEVLRGKDEYTAYEYRFMKAEGSEVNLNAHALPLRDEDSKSLGVVVVADDITQEQKLMSTFSRYVTRSVVEQLMKDPNKLKLGGTRPKATGL